MRFKIPNRAVDHLKQIPEMALLIQHCPNYAPREIIKDPFEGMVYNIIFQQISFEAGLTVFKRFSRLFPQGITPTHLLAIPTDQLQACGLSFRKVAYCQNIAQAFLKKPLFFSRQNLLTEDTETISTKLQSIKGVGQWTVQMFLMFTLQKEDVRAFGDLAIRKGIAWLMQSDGELSRTDFKKFTDRCAPYNTYAHFFLWEITLQQFFKYPSIFHLPIQQ
ncbi:hypothetical protein [Persicobacter psychrovividus]|uniref:DNA-3-methyladenine glycosylase II n=1 Tax=Persicobacter psychrovividus TaxID=387638 RepID=A0ABM7VGP2_9BACT|nr:DNA-3-methyladenine glycosidase [Persicobacter psychrovividus]